MNASDHGAMVGTEENDEEGEDDGRGDAVDGFHEPAMREALETQQGARQDLAHGGGCRQKGGQREQFGGQPYRALQPLVRRGHQREAQHGPRGE